MKEPRKNNHKGITRTRRGRKERKKPNKEGENHDDDRGEGIMIAR